ncbi:hypothetical protein RhiirA5_433202 [Rhizophagus irregularis]|uniref:Fungal-type protein kinase domain-containing protein n=2 Tax=Rhizophagus irregularis TaxID=588596 RepID=A0A2N0NS65_9GLOM|nr:hypothetical protein RhiirA5_433202 [Rhizophagus irregularis]
MSQSQALVIDEIMEKCKQEEKWNNEWIGWPKDGSLETQFYQPVLVLVNYVIQQCNRTSGKFARTAVVHANCCPIQNRICAVARKSDIVLVDCSNVQRREGEPVVRWSDIHVVGEIKRTDKNDNVNTDLELAGYVREIFGNQPTRRFVFGFTICGASIRIWLFDRSGGIGSHAFSIHKDPKMFIRVITEFATMGDSQLGYDPSVLVYPFSIGRMDFKKDMHSVSEGQSGTTAESKIERFVLVKKIFHRAVICGRATVCWKAHRLDEDGKELMDKAYIIKDSWRSTLRDYIEGDLLKKATIALKDTVNSQVTKYYYHEDVTIFPISDPAVYQQSQGSKIVDDTFECIRKKLFLSLDDNGRVDSEFHANNPAGNPDCEIHEPLQSCSIGSTSSAVNVNNIPLKKPEYRIHTRLVTSTYGKPIYHFNDHLELLVAFRDTIKGHRNLYQIARILHRDISLYNILIGDDGRGFIIDLDYAIDTGSCQEKNKVQGHRTGTLPFMAIDILLQQSAHGFQHDLESFFYVLCWICCEFEGPCGTPRDKGCERKNLIAWATGLPENIGFMKLGMMQQFDYVMDTFSPYFKSFHHFMRKLHKMMFTAGRIKHDISYEKILKVFQDEIKRRDDENLPTNFGDLGIGT